MPRKHSGGGGKSALSSAGKKAASAAPGARIKKIDRYEDTIEPGSVDDFMFKRDEISFNPQNDDDDDDDINAGQGEEVLSLHRTKPRKMQASAEDDEDEDEDDGEEEVIAPKKKERKTKGKIDVTGKGRFGKPVVSSDDDSGSASGSGSGSGSDSDEDDEGWGRSYYSRPSTRREKERDGVDDEKREEERDMEEKEVRRMYRKQREAMEGDDWGLAEVEEAPVVSAAGEEEETQLRPVPAPPTSADPATLLRHLEAHEPVKLALARDFPLIVKKLEKTARGIKKLEEAEKEGELHKGLGWLHYQTLLTYATTLAYYIHLCSLPVSERPDPEIPILPRLLQLKEGVAMLEDLDFAAGSVSDGAVVLNRDLDDEDGDGEDVQEGKMELINRMREADGMEWEEEADDLWGKEGLEDGELEELLKDAKVEAKTKAKKSKKDEKAKKGKKVDDEDDDNYMDGVDGLDEFDFGMDDEEEIKPKKEKKIKKAKAAAKSGSTVAPAFAPLAEPEFFSAGTSTSKSSKSRATTSGATNTYADDMDLDISGDPTSLTDADFSDKQSRKRSLAFHTSKINQTLARRAEGRANRMGGDEDLPYRDRRKGRDAALRKNGPAGAEGEDLEPASSASDKDEGKKRSRNAGLDEDAGAGGEDDEADGYYELVKRRRKEFKDAKEAAHEEREAERLAAIAAMDDDSTEGGPRALTRAIEKNRGLTPRRSKSGRNPRVKKRQAYEKAKKKVASQRSVYKGGQSALGGSYSGEKTGITKVVKSRKF